MYTTDTHGGAVILDSGSQRLYVTDQLSLIPQGEQQMSIVTFGTSEGEPTACEVVRLGMEMKTGQDGIHSACCTSEMWTFG